MAAKACDYRSPGVTVDAFFRSTAFVKGIRGPFGSGKSSACVMVLLDLAQRQVVRPSDGRKHSRMIVIRNTYAELKTTTIKTWHSWIPETVGHWVAQGPPTHRIVDETLDMEVVFLALDRPADLKKVLGLECTGVWINEAREVPKDLIDGLTGRVGRYPAVRDGGCVDPCIIMDTNPPELQHWWYVLAEKDSTTQRNADLLASVEGAEKELREKGHLGPRQPLFQFFAQPDANSVDAENRENLPSDYYPKLSAGKSEEWRKVYIRGEYGFVQTGQPVYHEFREKLHVKEFELNRRIGLSIGCDWGLTPAASIGQKSANGIQRVKWEVVTSRAGAKQFAGMLKDFLNTNCAAFEVESITGDPSGDAGSQTDSDDTCFRIMKANGFPDIKPARTNDFTVRREVHGQAMSKLIDGEAGWQCDPRGCPTLRRGMAGQYRFEQVQVLGDVRYHPKPLKNEVSHVCEADQYRMIGCGEDRVVIRGTLGGKRIRPAYSEM
jgi:hypothetical protein